MISIILTAKDRHAELDRFLRGIQKFPPDAEYEIIVVAPDTEYIPMSLAYTLVPIKTNNKVLNLCHARNVGAEYAKYDWLVFLDVDIVPSDAGTFPAIIKTLKIASANDCFGGLRWDLNKAKSVIGHQNAFWGYCHIIHKKMFAKINGYNESFIGHGHEDAEIHQRLLNAGATITIIRDASFIHNWHEMGRNTWARPEGHEHKLLKEGAYRMPEVNGKHVLDVETYRAAARKAEEELLEFKQKEESRNAQLTEMRNKVNEANEKESKIEKLKSEAYNKGRQDGTEDGKQSCIPQLEMLERTVQANKEQIDRLKRIEKLWDDYENSLKKVPEPEPVLKWEGETYFDKIVEPKLPWYKRLLGLK